MSIRDYIKIARPDHWTKHVFIVPGIILSYMLSKERGQDVVFNVIIGFSSACCIASANYVINEWLDREFDKFHPVKKNRPAVSVGLKAKWVYLEHALLVVLGLYLGAQVGLHFLFVSIFFAIMGIVYNVRPFRSKDRVFIDVLTESINNPIRLLLGWFMISRSTIPPVSLVVFYWFGGAFLMAAKRLSEFRSFSAVGGIENLKYYRASFVRYTEKSLLVSAFVYALLSAFLIATFLIKYRTEYIILFPILTTLFAYYLSISIEDVSVAQTPESLYKDWKLVLLMSGLVVGFLFLSFYDMPMLDHLLSSKVIRYDDVFNR